MKTYPVKSYTVERLTPQYTLQSDENNPLPLEKLMPGDSMFIPEEVMSNRTVRRMTSHYSLNSGTRFTTHAEPGGARVWRRW